MAAGLAVVVIEAWKHARHLHQIAFDGALVDVVEGIEGSQLFAQLLRGDAAGFPGNELQHDPLPENGILGLMPV